MCDSTGVGKNEVGKLGRVVSGEVGGGTKRSVSFDGMRVTCVAHSAFAHGEGEGTMVETMLSLRPHT